jgi:hypothetical protein
MRQLVHHTPKITTPTPALPHRKGREQEAFPFHVRRGVHRRIALKKAQRIQFRGEYSFIKCLTGKFRAGHHCPSPPLVKGGIKIHV